MPDTLHKCSPAASILTSQYCTYQTTTCIYSVELGSICSLEQKFLFEHSMRTLHHQLLTLNTSYMPNVKINHNAPVGK